MAVAAILAAANTFAGIFSDKKDAERLDRNAFAYGLAQSSRNQAAADFLKGRANLMGSAGIQVAGFGDKDSPGIIGPWATQKAQADAKAKYDSLRSSGVIDTTGKVVAVTVSNTSQTPALNIQAAGVTSLPLWLWVVLGGTAAWYAVKALRKA